MKNTGMHKGVLATALLVTALITGCSSVGPVPEGEELVWQSKKDIPEWTYLPSPMVVEDDNGLNDITVYRFTGLSLRHSSERIARETAINNATMALVRYVNQKVEAQVDETFQSAASEVQTSNGVLTIDNSLKIDAKAIMQRVEVKDLYLERWTDRGRLFFKAYALVQIPEDELIAGQWMGKADQTPDPEVTIIPAPSVQAQIDAMERGE